MVQKHTSFFAEDGLIQLASLSWNEKSGQTQDTAIVFDLEPFRFFLW